MATTEELAYLVRVNDRDLKELKRNIDTVNKAADKDLGAASTKADGHLRKMGAAASIAAAGTGIVLVGALKKSIDAAKDSQKVQQATEVQLRALGINYKAHAKQIDSVVSSTSKLAALDDEDLQQSFTRLLPATHNVNKALQQMQLAADLARARNISLESATNLVVRANTGSAGALRRLGISLVATTTNVDKARAAYRAYTKTHKDVSDAERQHFADLIATAKQADKNAQATKNLSVLQKTFAGASETYGKSAAGAQERLGVAIENLQESLGTALLPIVTQVSNAFAKFADVLSSHQHATALVIKVLGALALGVGAVIAAQKLYAAGTLVVKAATTAWTGAQWLLNAALDANPIGLVVIAIAALAAGLIIAYKKSETFRDIVNAAFGSVIATGRKIETFFTQTIPNAFEAALSWLRRNWPIIAVLISGPFAPLVALATNAFGVRSALEGALDAVRTKASNVIGDVVGFFTGMPKRMEKGLGQIIDALDPFREILHKIWQAISGVIEKFQWLIDHAKSIAGVFGKIGGAAKSIGGKIGGIIPGDGIASIQNGVVSVPGSLAGAAGPASVSTELYDDLALGRSFGLAFSSGYRPGAITSTGNPSLHGTYPAKAVDQSDGSGLGWASAAMRGYFMAELARGAPGIAELILSPYWWHPGSGITAIPPNAGSVLKDHYSHVHTGIFDQGGYLPPGLTLALNLTGRPERVVAPHQEGPVLHVEHMEVRSDTDVELVASAVSRRLAFR